jgi:hypothetical protein
MILTQTTVTTSPSDKSLLKSGFNTTHKTREKTNKTCRNKIKVQTPCVRREHKKVSSPASAAPHHRPPPPMAISPLAVSGAAVATLAVLGLAVFACRRCRRGAPPAPPPPQASSSSSQVRRLPGKSPPFVSFAPSVSRSRDGSVAGSDRGLRPRRSRALRISVALLVRGRSVAVRSAIWFRGLGVVGGRGGPGGTKR